MSDVTAPAGLSERAMALWEAASTDYEFDAHETELLIQAVKTVSLLDGLDAVIAADGLMSMSSQGSRVHPAITERRAQALTLARLLATLRLPSGEQEEAGELGGRGQRRGGARAPYSMGGAV